MSANSLSLKRLSKRRQKASQMQVQDICFAARPEKPRRLLVRQVARMESAIAMLLVV